jgi:hypothetical protein
MAAAATMSYTPAFATPDDESKVKEANKQRIEAMMAICKSSDPTFSDWSKCVLQQTKGADGKTVFVLHKLVPSRVTVGPLAKRPIGPGAEAALHFTLDSGASIPLLIQTPSMSSGFGAAHKYVAAWAKWSYEFSTSFYRMDTEVEILRFYRTMQALEARVAAIAFEQRQAWFRQPNASPEVVESWYTNRMTVPNVDSRGNEYLPLIKYSIDARKDKSASVQVFEENNPAPRSFTHLMDRTTTDKHFAHRATFHVPSIIVSGKGFKTQAKLCSVSYKASRNLVTGNCYSNNDASDQFMIDSAGDNAQGSASPMED